MADVEMIFPEKIVGIKPFQLVNLAVTVFTALMTGAVVLWRVSSSGKWQQAAHASRSSCCLHAVIAVGSSLVWVVHCGSDRSSWRNHS
jgi:cytochrome bd-type quinol oxidase subunit 2